MNRAKLTLLACPTLLASTLLAHIPAQATEVTTPTNTVVSTPDKPVIEIVFERPTSESSTPKSTEQLSEDDIASDDCSCSGETPTLNFTDQESNAAIQRYGCDCAGCLNALRQLQGKQPLL